MFSPTDRVREGARDWKTMPNLRTLAGSRVMSRPFSRMAPRPAPSRPGDHPHRSGLRRTLEVTEEADELAVGDRDRHIVDGDLLAAGAGRTFWMLKPELRHLAPSAGKSIWLKRVAMKSRWSARALMFTLIGGTSLETLANSAGVRSSRSLRIRGGALTLRATSSWAWGEH